jgi:hypothetical protein
MSSFSAGRRLQHRKPLPGDRARARQYLLSSAMLVSQRRIVAMSLEDLEL